MNSTGTNINLERPVKIADGVFWVGFYDTQTGLRCNPFLIVDHDEAVIIDGGSRPDFPIVTKKILQTGIDLSTVQALIYQHYDPDLCGSLPNLEDIIENDDLKIVSDKQNLMFIRHYSTRSKLVTLNQLNHEFKFSSGRTLKFFNTPYSHSAGSFVTLDVKTGVLFSSDLFGSYSPQKGLFLNFEHHCDVCSSENPCPKTKNYCSIPDILKFHRKIMTSTKALRYALNVISQIPYKIIAPQHGGIIVKHDDANYIINQLKSLENVGIDAFQ